MQVDSSFPDSNSFSSYDGWNWNYTSSFEERCELDTQDLLAFKFYLVGVVGTLLAVVGISLNIVTFALLMKRTLRTTASNTYLATLVVFDAMCLALLVMFHSVEYIYQFTGNAWLYELWFGYVRLVYALYGVASTGQTYATMVLVFERFLALAHPNRHRRSLVRSAAPLFVCLLTCWAVLFNGARYFEFAVASESRCAGRPFGHYTLQPSDIRFTWLYGIVFTLWISPIVTAYGPFILTSFWVIAIVKNMPGSSQVQEEGNNTSKAKTTDDEVTNMVVVVGILFIVHKCIISIIIISELTFTDVYMNWIYVIGLEMIKLIEVVNGACKFVLYCIFSKRFRSQITGAHGNNSSEQNQGSSMIEETRLLA